MAVIYQFPSGKILEHGSEPEVEEYEAKDYGEMISEAIVTMAEDGYDPTTAVLVMRDEDHGVCIISSSGEVNNDSIVSTLQRAVTKASTTPGYIYEDEE